jgi:AcrR family transcriptional regulator
VANPRTRLDPERRRELIVDAAARVLEGREPMEVTFEEIADEAGVSRALVYNYFGDRWGVLAAVYERAVRRLDDELAESVDLTRPPSELVHAVVAGYVRFARANAATWRLLQAAGTVAHPSVQGTRRSRILKLAASWGDTPEARLAAFGAVGLLEAATIDWLHGSDLGPDAVADVLGDLLWTGLSSLGPHGVTVSGDTSALTAARP